MFAVVLGYHVERHHVWLATAPVGLHGLVWDVVCLAAVAALELGRQRMYGGREGARVSGATMDRICAEVIADFWARLAAFARVAPTPKGWETVRQDHPFLASSQTGQVVFRGPPADLVIAAVDVPV